MVGKILKEWRTSQGKNEWFMMWDEEDVMRYRGGYYVGLRVMQEISSRHGLGLQDLILLNAKDLESLALKVVSELAMKEPAYRLIAVSRPDKNSNKKARCCEKSAGSFSFGEGFQATIYQIPDSETALHAPARLFVFRVGLCRITESGDRLPGFA